MDRWMDGWMEGRMGGMGGGHLGGGKGQTSLTPPLSLQWDLVCSYRQLRQMAQSIYMAGVLVGALVLGGLSDK